MSEVQLPSGVTPEMVQKWKDEYKIVKIATLFDPEESQELGEVILKCPDAQTLNQFERLLDRDPLKAKLTIIKGTFLTRREDVDTCDKASKLFAAMYDAAAQMLPVGKARVKNL